MLLILQRGVDCSNALLMFLIVPLPNELGVIVKYGNSPPVWPQVFKR